MRKYYISLLAAIAFSLNLASQVNHLVISQLYGSGGNTGASYNRDFVELFNPTGSLVSLAGYSLQYTSGTGTTWASRNLSGSIAPNSYFLIQMTASGTTGAALPAPDLVVASNDMSATAGKLALVNGTPVLSGACPLSASIIDFVGYGPATNCFEGSNPAPAPGSNAQSISRNNNGCTDSGNNASDLVPGAANPRNSASPANVCPIVYSITTGTVNSPPFCISPASVATGSLNFTSTGTYNGIFTALLSDASGSFITPTVIGSVSLNGTNPSGIINIIIPANMPDGTGYRIRVDATGPATTGLNSVPFEIVNGVKNITGLYIGQGQTIANINWINPPSCYDEILVIAKQGWSITATPTGDGSSYFADALFTGSGTPFDGGKVVYKGTANSVTVIGLVSGGDYYFKIFTRYGTSWSTGAETHITSLGVLNHLVISQLYGGGGNSGATFTNDFVELFNPTNSLINLAGYSLQYASATGNNWGANKMDLSGTVAAHGYFLIKLAGGVNGSPLPTADLTGTINMGASAGKLALVANAIALVPNCPTASAYVDLVGYGNSDCGEGGVTATATSNTTSLFRATAGCIDSDNNNADFSTSTPSPRNSASPLNNCPLAGPLPVRFTHFKVNEESRHIKLSWTNETEEKISFYTAERSTDGRIYVAIGKMIPLKNDNSRADYVYTDDDFITGNNYYRIKAVELDGNIIYSSIARISVNAYLPGILLYPNPVKGNELVFQINKLSKGNYTIKVFNTSGQLVVVSVIQHSGGAITGAVSLGHLTAGLYCFRIDGSQQLQQQFLVE